MNFVSSSVEELVQQLIDHANEGRSIDIDAVIRAFPQWSAELHELLPILKTLHDSKPHLFPDATNAFKDSRGRRIANYEIGRVIGRGGMGVVYEATQCPLGRKVAIKLLNEVDPSPKARQRFEQEFQIAANLHHTNIVPVFDAGEDEGQLYFAMQLIEGTDINAWAAVRGSGAGASNVSTTNALTRTIDLPILSRNSNEEAFQVAPEIVDKPSASIEQVHGDQGNMPLGEKVKTVAKVARALHYAHQKGVLHRDIKPSNILIDRDQNPWISDFGLAKLSDSVGNTRSSELAGTVRYLAPERLRGSCDARSDIYSLGLVLMELVTGKPAWDGLDAPVIIKKISGSESCINSSCAALPADLRLIIQKAVSPHPEVRYSTARQLADDLENFVESRPVSARPLSSVRNGYLWVRRNPVVAALGATIFITLVTGTVIASVLAWNWRNAAVLARENERAATEGKNRAVKAEADAHEESSNALGALRFLSGILRQTTPYSSTNQNMTARDLLKCVNDRLESTPNLRPLVEMEVRHSLGSIYWGLGDFQDAEIHLTKALELANASKKPNQNSTINIIYDLAMLYWLQSDFKKAAPLFATVVANRERLLGDDHFKTLEAVNGLGLIQVFRDEPEKAEKLYRDILASEPKNESEVREQEESLVVLLRRGLALACLVQEKFDEAETILDEVLNKHRDRYGDASPETIVTRSMLATVYLNTNRPDLCLPHAEEAYRVRENLFGRSSPHTLTSAALLARAYLVLKRDADAKPLIDSLLDMAEPIRDRLPPFTIQELSELGLQLLVDRRYMEAERFLRFTADITVSKFPASWKGPYLQSALGECLIGLERMSEADPLIHNSAQMLESRQGLIPAPSRDRRILEVSSRSKLLVN